MPRKAKEKKDENEIIDEIVSEKVSSTKKKASTRRKASTLQNAEVVSDTEVLDEKKTTAKKTSTRKKASTKKADDATSDAEVLEEKKTTAKKTSTRKKASSKKADDATSDTEVLEEKKTTTKKTTTKKATTRKRIAKKDNQEQLPIQITEYYDLPYKYGNTIIRLLAQTPKTLFIYWEVSDLDIANFKKLYGDNFFNITKPVIIVHNLTYNKTYEVEINDFANCWYLNTEDSDCKFDIELGRRFIKPDFKIRFEQPDYIHIATSNDIQSPNDHILFEKLKEFVVFKDVRNNRKIKKNIKSFKFLRDIYNFYQDMYEDEILKNPSSQFKF